MSKKPPVHTVKTDRGWGNKREGSSRVDKHYGTKAEAQRAGRETAKRDNTEHLIHNQNGKIGSRNSYGNDPHPPRG